MGLTFHVPKVKIARCTHMCTHIDKEILCTALTYLADLELCSPVLFHFVPHHLGPPEFTTSQRISISKQWGFTVQMLCPPQLNSQLVCLVAKKLIILFIL